MARLIQIVNHDDGCSLLLVIVILTLIGGHIASPAERLWAFRLALVVFLIYGASRFIASAPHDAEGLLTLTVRAALAGGLTLGIGWITFPLLTVLTHAAIITPYLAIVKLIRGVVQRHAEERQRATRAAEEEREKNEKRETETQAARERSEQAERQGRERDQHDATASAKKAAARTEIERWYAENEAFLADEFPRLLFQAWLVQHLTTEASAEKHWEEIEQLIAQLNPIAVRIRKERQSAGKSINPNTV